MVRIHKSLAARIRKVDAGKVANTAEDYLYGCSIYRRDLSDITGIVKEPRIKSSIRHIDAYEKDIIKLENKIENLEIRRAKEAVKLKEFIDGNLEIIREIFEPDEFRDFL